MKLVPIANLQVPTLDSNTPPYASRPVPLEMPRLHILGAIIGGRGSGKTTAALKLLKMYVAAGSYDKIFWYSPTAKREDKMAGFVEYCRKKDVEVRIYDTYGDAQFQELQAWMGGEIDAYKRYLQQLAVWQRFVRAKSSDHLSVEDLIALDNMDWKRPTSTYKHYPSFCLVLDDQAGKKDVFASNCKNQMSNFMILHRHLSCSVLCLLQIVANGLPRQLRSNISMWMLFPCKSATLKRAVCEELAFKMGADELMRAWDYATTQGKGHDFLMLDYDEPDPARMMRKNFTHYLLPGEAEEPVEEEEEAAD